MRARLSEPSPVRRLLLAGGAMTALLMSMTVAASAAGVCPDGYTETDETTYSVPIGNGNEIIRDVDANGDDTACVRSFEIIGAVNPLIDNNKPELLLDR